MKQNSEARDEIEVKIEVSAEELERVRSRLQEFGFTLTATRRKEENRMFDFSDRRLQNTGCALRLRDYSGKCIFTYKGPQKPDPLLKIREEIETSVADFDSIRRILEAIGLEETFQYGKYREKYARELASGPVEICLDETPVGCFVEIEGSRQGIDEIAGSFNWAPERFIQRNYIDLYRERMKS